MSPSISGGQRACPKRSATTGSNTSSSVGRTNRSTDVLIDLYKHDTGFTRVGGGNPFVSLDSAGELSISTDYAWDGPSGPTIDTRDFMRGSLVHDALYQFMRERVLDHRKERKHADKLLRIIVRKDGMSRMRAWWVYRAVRLFGGSAARPS